VLARPVILGLVEGVAMRREFSQALAGAIRIASKAAQAADGVGL